MIKIHDSLKDGGQSDVYLSNNGERVDKHYFLPIETVEKYNFLMTLLSGKSFKKNLKKQTHYKGKLVNKVSVRFVNFNKNIKTIYSGKNEKQVVNVRYVQGCTLKESTKLEQIREILKVINDYIKSRFGLNMDDIMYLYQIHESNIKVESISDSGEFSLVVTDISCQIDEFIARNTERIGELMNT